jgi:predicted MFS family arabinose efflux permease
VITSHRTVGSCQLGAEPHPLAIPDFRSLWTGALVSLTGAQMQFVALPYYVHDRTGSASATALTAFVQVLPRVTVAPLAGAIADRFGGRRLLTTSNAVLAAVTAALCLAPQADWWVAVVVVGVQAVLAQLVGPAEHVVLPRVVTPGQLAAANGLSSANQSIARLVGPPTGALLYASVGLAGVAVANAVTFAVAALITSRLRDAWSAASSPDRLAYPRSAGLRRPVGWQECRRNLLLGRLLWVLALTGIGEGFVVALLAPYVSEVFGSSVALGVILSCQAAGGVCGAALITRWLPTRLAPAALGWGCVGCGLLLMPLLSYPLVYPALWPALLLVALAGVPFAAVAAAQTTILQLVPRAAARGRVFGTAAAVSGSAQLLAIAISGPLADRTSVYVVLVDAPCYVLAGVLVLWPGRFRRSDDDHGSDASARRSPPWSVQATAAG